MVATDELKQVVLKRVNRELVFDPKTNDWRESTIQFDLNFSNKDVPQLDQYFRGIQW